jgi:hypothetical protein
VIGGAGHGTGPRFACTRVTSVVAVAFGTLVVANVLALVSASVAAGERPASLLQSE